MSDCVRENRRRRIVAKTKAEEANTGGEREGKDAERSNRFQQLRDLAYSGNVEAAADLFREFGFDFERHPDSDSCEAE